MVKPKAGSRETSRILATGTKIEMYLKYKYDNFNFESNLSIDAQYDPYFTFKAFWYIV